MLNLVTITAMGSEEHLNGQIDYSSDYAELHQLEPAETTVSRDEHLNGQTQGFSPPSFPNHVHNIGSMHRTTSFQTTLSKNRNYTCRSSRSHQMRKKRQAG